MGFRREAILTGPSDRSTFTIDHGFALRKVDVPLPKVHLPPLSALARVEIQLYTGGVTGRLVDLLSSIHSALVLSSVTFTFPMRHPASVFPPPGPWVSVDEWLARLVSDCGRSGGGLVVMLKPWPEGNSNWEGYFPAFRKAGGHLTVELPTVCGLRVVPVLSLLLLDLVS